MKGNNKDKIRVYVDYSELMDMLNNLVNTNFINFKNTLDNGDMESFHIASAQSKMLDEIRINIMNMEKFVE